MEAAADEVVHAARAHAVEGSERHLELPSPQEELDRRGRRELGRAAEAAPLRVVLPAQHAYRAGEQLFRQRLTRRLELRAPPQPCHKRRCLAHDVVTLRPVGLGDG